MRQAEVQYFRARRKKRFGRPGQSTTTRSPKIGECRWEDTALKLTQKRLSGFAQLAAVICAVGYKARRSFGQPIHQASKTMTRNSNKP